MSIGEIAFIHVFATAVVIGFSFAAGCLIGRSMK